MNGATQKIEQMESDRLTTTELIQVKPTIRKSLEEFCTSSKPWIQSRN